jgi:hypothetical protein
MPDGESINWTGEISLHTFRSSGNFTLDSFDLAERQLQIGKLALKSGDVNDAVDQEGKLKFMCLYWDLVKDHGYSSAA